MKGEKNMFGNYEKSISLLQEKRVKTPLDSEDAIWNACIDECCMVLKMAWDAEEKAFAAYLDKDIQNHMEEGEAE